VDPAGYMSATAFTTAPAPLVAVAGSLPLGGSSTFLVNFARALRRRGQMLPVVVLDSENAYAADFATIGNPVHVLPAQKMIFEDRLLWAYRQAAQYQPRAVLSCLSSQSFEILRVVPRGVLRMSIVQSDDPGPYGTVDTHAAWTDVVVGVSRQIGVNLQARPALRGVRAEVIPYGIGFSAATPRAPRPDAAPLRLIYLGRVIEEQKRVSRLAELAKLLQAQRVPVEFTIVGEGPQRDELRAALKGCDFVRFLDPVSYEQVPRLLQDFDVFVLLSDFEGLPLSLLEAMGAGVVPVVSDLPSGMADVVDETRGVRVPVGDVERTAEVIGELHRDRTRLHDCATNAARFARAHYSADAMAEKYLRVIEERAAPVQAWPESVEIPVPRGVARPWLYSGVPRMARRWMKRLGGN
jgi:glycosyltransferase involved in cell wall biosynthesis